jgi:hypothetical protein
MSKWYILDDDNNPVPSTGLESCDWMDGNPERKAVKQEHVDDVFISTVFLGLDHAWLDASSPLLWETMIFGGEHDQYQERYTSYEDALEGHKIALNLVNQK